VRAAQTLRLVFPAVVVLIFVICTTYHDLADAALMMLAVPKRYGWRVFMYLFRRSCKVGMHGHDFMAPSLHACFGMATETASSCSSISRSDESRRAETIASDELCCCDRAQFTDAAEAVHRRVAIIAIFPRSRHRGGETLPDGFLSSAACSSPTKSSICSYPSVFIGCAERVG
jgi:hypothetical protein